MKQAIIIGASSGIGYELAIQLAAQGYQLGLMARRIERLNELSELLPGEHFVQVTDLVDTDIARTQTRRRRVSLERLRKHMRWARRRVEID